MTAVGKNTIDIWDKNVLWHTDLIMFFSEIFKELVPVTLAVSAVAVYHYITYNCLVHISTLAV